MSKYSDIIFRKYDLIKTPPVFDETENNLGGAAGNDRLKDVKCTYNRAGNSITINREQELENNEVAFRRFVLDEDNIRESYVEREVEGVVWNYFLKQEFDPSGKVKRIEGIINHSDGLTYTYVNGAFPELYHSGETMTINGTRYPEYCNTNVRAENVFGLHDARLLWYHYYDFICEQGGKTLYYAIGLHEEEKNKSASAKVVLKSIEYQKDHKSFRYEIDDDAEPGQVKRLLKKLLKDRNVDVIRVIGGIKEAEIIIYGNEEKYVIAVRDDTGIRYARNGKFNTQTVQEFGLRIPQICVVEYPVYVEDFVGNIICSDYGHKLMAWVYFLDEDLQPELPPLDFSEAEILKFSKTKKPKPKVRYTAFAYKTDPLEIQSLEQEKLESMTAKKMYEFAVKQLESGKLTYLSVCAVCGEEDEQNLVLYGDGKGFSVGMIDRAEETALCYDNGTGDDTVVSPGGQDFPAAMIIKDIQVLKSILKEFFEKGRCSFSCI